MCASGLGSLIARHVDTVAFCLTWPSTMPVPGMNTSSIPPIGRLQHCLLHSSSNAGRIERFATRSRSASNATLRSLRGLLFVSCQVRLCFWLRHVLEELHGAGEENHLRPAAQGHLFKGCEACAVVPATSEWSRQPHRFVLL